MTERDESFMALALRLARRGLGRTAPNPSVGAVLVHDRGAPIVIGRGWTAPGGRPHAEAAALERAGPLAAGATLYVTLEPCAHVGRAGSCTQAIMDARVARVVCALQDPDPRTDGLGLRRLAEAGIEVVVGPGAAEARWLALGHVLRVRQRRPFVQLKLAVGADGRMAPGAGAPVWVTGEVARARGHLLRARADAILVGRGTVAADDPLLTCRLPGLEPASPIRIVLDSDLQTPPSARLLAEAARPPVWIAAATDAAPDRTAALTAAGADILFVPRAQGGGVDLAALMTALSDRGVTRLLVEGGPTVARSFLDAGLVDEAVIFAGDRAAGAGGLRPLGPDGLDRLTAGGQFILQEERALGPDRMAVYRRKD